MRKHTTQAIKTRQNKLTQFLKKLPGLGLAISLLIWGLLMGSIFTFLMDHTQGPVSVEEARPVSAVMEDVRGQYSRHRTAGRRLDTIYIRFADHEQLHIDAPVATEALLDELLAIAPGTRFNVLVHPNSATILALAMDGEEIMAFDESVAKLARENTGFFWLGMAMYLMAAYSAVVILLRLILRRY